MRGMTRRIFHLSIPVDDLRAAVSFYTRVLGAKVGRRREDWTDILLWGHQITLQLRPAQVRPVEDQGKTHFGVVLPWDTWQSEAKRLQESATPFLKDPHVLHAGGPEEQAKLYLADPSNNIIEIKAYRDFAGVLGSDDVNYGRA